MATLTADWTGAVPTGLQTTQPMITQRFLEMTGFGQVGETSVVSTTLITDADMLTNPIANELSMKGGWVRMVGGTSANLGAIRPIQGYDAPTGTLTIYPALPAATADGDAYEVWLTPMHPSTVINILNRLATQHGLSLPSYSVLSEIPDFDMEQSGTAAWSATNATIAKVAWAAGTEGISGKQALSVTTTSANGYVTPQRALGAEPGAGLWVSALFTPSNPAVTNTGFLQLVDASGSVIEQITTTAKSTVRLFRHMSNSGTNGVVSIRVGSQESGVVGIWDDIVLLDSSAKDFPLPSWMQHQSALKEVYHWRPGNYNLTTDAYDPALSGEKTVNYAPQNDAFGSGQIRIRSTFAAPTMPFVQGTRSETAWSSLTEVKHIDIPWAAAALAVHVYDAIIGRSMPGNVDMKALMAVRNKYQDDYDKHNLRVMSRRRTNDAGPVVWEYRK